MGIEPIDAADPWADASDEPPRWFGQQAGLMVALVIGVVAIVLIVAAMVAFTFLVRGGT